MALRRRGWVLFQVLNSRQPVNSSLQSYSRWAHRNPAKVLLPFVQPTKTDLKKEVVIDLSAEIANKTDEKTEKSSPKVAKNLVPPLVQKSSSGSTLSLEKTKEIKSKKEEKLKKRKFYLSQAKVFDDNNEIIYEKLMDNDSRIISLLTAMKSKKERQRTQQMLVEGWRLIVDGLDTKCKLKYVMFSKVEDLNNLRPFLPKTGVLFYKIPYKDIQLWSDVETPPGIFGIFEMPNTENIKRRSKPLPLHLICDNIRVPGNLGAILRVAVGAGCEKVILTKGCVDLWDPKVIRSAAGAHFRLPIHSSVEWDEIPKLLEDNTSVFVADSNAQVLDSEDSEQVDGLNIPVLPYYSVEFQTLNHVTLIVGGETEGISEDSYSLAMNKNGLRLNIPMQKGVDSLNTGMATAVIAFEIRKQLKQAQIKMKMARMEAGN